MERLKGKREVKREQTTRLISEASAGLETADLATVTAWRERISACNQSLRSLNAEIEDQVPLEELVAEYTTVSEYDDDATRVLALLGCKIASLRQKELPTPVPLNETRSATASVPPPNRTSGVKLPKLRLLTFNGDVSGWQSFWEQFSGAVHNNDTITRSEKFHYLRTLVTGPAAAAIAGLQATEACYDDAIHILTQRFGDRRRIEQDHLAKLRSLPPVASANDTRGLRRIYDHVQTNIRGLRGLGVGSSTYCTMMSDILLRALPKEIVLDYHRRQSGNTAYRASGTSERDPTSPNATGQDAGRSIDSLSSARICPSPLQSEDAEGELAEILGFLRVEVEGRERAGIAAETRHPRQTPAREGYIERRGHTTWPTAAVLNTNAVGCFFCRSAKHQTESCTGDLVLEQKKRRLAEDMRCFRCTTRGHRAKDCRRKVKCASCGGRHASSMCDPNWTPPKRVNTNLNTTSVVNSNVTMDSGVLLQTFRASAVGDRATSHFRGVIDGGSQRTFIHTDVSRKLNLRVIGTTNLQLNTFGETSTRAQRRRLVEVRLRSQHDGKECVLEAIEVPFICNDILQVPVDHDFVRSIEADGGLIADMTPTQGTEPRRGISFLLGSDQLWKVTRGEVRRFRENESMVAIDTIFGWTFQGPISLHSTLSGSTNTMVCVLKISTRAHDENEATLRRFWELDSLGITDEPKTNSEELEAVKSQFERTITKVDGRYEVALPWKETGQDLQDNRVMAHKRLEGLLKRLSRNEQLLDEYDRSIRNYMTAGHAEKVPERALQADTQRVYYMPHQAVVRSCSSTTRLRIVFDASSHRPGCSPLNEHLEKGPKLNADLVGILVRFRLFQVAITADIEKAFLQIGVRTEDRDALRFLWFETKPTSGAAANIEEWRMTRVPFGTTSSPFLLTATLMHHLDNVKDQHRETADRLRNAFYVDDLLIGASDVGEARQIHDEANAIMSEAGMRLRKWTSNAAELQCGFDETEEPQASQEPRKVLGLVWQHNQDKLLIPMEGVLHFVSTAANTKRFVLQASARVFDPLGLIAPYMIRVKIIFQQLWEREIGWDAELPDDLSELWQRWCTELPLLKALAVGRCTMRCPAEGARSVQLHVFCDASLLAYGSCAYLRVEGEDGDTSTCLVLAKSRVAPLKRLTLPRLELMGTVIGTRLARYLNDTMNLQMKTFYWTDSTIALHWIKGQASKWKPFVGNRVNEIQSASDPASWNHCPGSQNPADMLTRGISAETLIESEQWWQGPEWLSTEPCNWPKGQVFYDSIPEVQEERKKEHHVLHTAEVKGPELLNLSSYSRIMRPLRVTAWMFRFIKNSRNKQERAGGPLTAEELEQAENYWIVKAQEAYRAEMGTAGGTRSTNSETALLKPFVDADGRVRVGGRLQNAQTDVTVRHPLLLPPSHPLTELIVNDAHRRTMHGGVQDTLNEVRERYWVPRVRQLARKVINRCNACRRARLRPASAPTAPLPEERVNRAAPFEVVGIDFAGPLLVKASPSDQKAYIALFTCAVTRAVHLELVSNLTTEAFIMAFQRFTARRGLPSVVYTDNALTFKKAAKDLCGMWDVLRNPHFLDHCSQNRIKWRFIAERAAWWGGFWERMVQTVKRSLRVILGKNKFGFEEMTTILQEVEAVVNSRPLAPVHDAPHEQEALTPAHFLSGGRLTALPSTSVENVPVSTRGDVTRRWRHRQRLLDQFWGRWQKEYLLQLRSAHRATETRTNDLRDGDLVLVHENKTPRLMWRMGRIEQVQRGRDNHVRSCLVRLPGGVTLRRPVQLLFPLELSE